MNKCYISLFIATLLIFNACRKEVSFDIHPVEVPVLNCLFTNDSLWKVTLSQSIAVNEKSKFTAIRNAQIDIYEDGQYYTSADVFQEPQDTVSIGYYTVSDINAVPRSGHTYSIEAKAGEWPMLSARDTMKSLPAFEDFALSNLYIEEVNVVEDTRPIFSLQGNLSLRVKNHADQKDYYAVKIYYLADVYTPGAIVPGQNNFVDTIYKDVVSFSATEVLGFDSYLWKDGYIFSDSLNTDEFIRLHLNLDGILYKKDTPPAYLYVELKSLSERYYRFQKSYLEHLQTALNPFSTPKSVFSNVENGVGIFAGSTVILDSIKIE